MVAVHALAMGTVLGAVTPGRDSGPPAEPTQIHYYRGSLAAAYAVPVTGGLLLAVGVDAGSPPIAFTGLVPLALGGIVPPIVHWTHGNLGRGFLAIGGQALGFTAGALIAREAAQCQSAGVPSDCMLASFGLGAALGTAAWGAFDVGFLAYEEEPSAEDTSFDWSPLVVPLRGGAWLGVAGDLPLGR